MTSYYIGQSLLTFWVTCYEVPCSAERQATDLPHVYAQTQFLKLPVTSNIPVSDPFTGLRNALFGRHPVYRCTVQIGRVGSHVDRMDE